MLVTSVFAHFFLMTVFMFLPRAITQAKLVIPAFRVNLIEAPSVEKIKPGQGIVKPQKRIAPAKPQKAAPLEKLDPAARLLRELDELSRKTLPAQTPPNSIVQELDKLAKMVPPGFKKTSPETIVSEEVVDDPLKELRNSETEPSAMEKTETQGPTTVELLEKLGKISALDSILKTKPQIEPSVVKQPETPLEKQETAFQPIIEKLDALAEPDRNVEISISVNLPEQDEFRSQIQLGEPSPSVSEQPGLTAAEDGEISADVLSVYIGKIRTRILTHWKSPLGANHKDKVFVSFYLFPGGNIDKPFLEKSSGKEQLDTLAIRAIFDSEPFPKFPDELKEPNLHIKIHFTYTPVDE